MKISFCYIIFILLFVYGCTSDFGTTDESKTETSLESDTTELQLKKLDLHLSNNEIEKLRKVDKIARKYGIEPSYAPGFDEQINILLEKDLDEIEGIFEELYTYKLYTEKSSEITKKWWPKLKEAETREEHDELYREYQKELAKLKEEMDSDLE